MKCEIMLNFSCLIFDPTVYIKKFSDLILLFFSFNPRLLNTVFNKCVHLTKNEFMNLFAIHRLLIRSLPRYESATKF